MTSGSRRVPVVLDTNVVSELMRPAPDPTVSAWAGRLPPTAAFTTAITVAEVRFGIARLPAGRRRTRLVDAADSLFAAFADQVLAFDAVAAIEYAEIVTSRERSGTPIGGFDAQIASICRVHDMALATRNVGDFGSLGLRLIDPWAESA